MTKIADVIHFLHEIAPNHLQEDYDNAGLIVGHPSTEITSILISLDCTEAVVDEAIALGANLIVSHHPIVFRGLKRFNGEHYVERVIIKAIKNEINLFAIHTNLDNVANDGVNQKIAEKIGLQDCTILRAKSLDPLIGAGMIGKIDPCSPEQFMQNLKTNMGLQYIKHTELCLESVSTIAVCGGAGSFLLQDAIRAGADVFISADFKYHEFFDANDEIIVLDIGHYESERFTIELLYTLISNKFINFAAHCTKVVTNPVKYY